MVGSQTKLDSARYDAKTVQEAIALAGRLQDEQRDTMTVDQIEAVASEAGVDPAFVQQALARMEKKFPKAVRQKDLPSNDSEAHVSRLSSRFRSISPALWWGVGWAVPGIVSMSHLGHDAVSIAGLIWVTGGIAVSILHKSSKEQNVNVSVQVAVTERATETVRATENVSREELLQTLFALEKQLEQGKEKRAFLSIDVVGSSRMKRDNSELGVEYSFGQYRRWLEERVRAEGGLLQSAAGDGTMCVFENEEIAERVAQMLIDDLPRFNREQNHLNQPFQIRCGVSEGEIAIEPGTPIGAWQSSVIDRAAILQKEAAPNTVLVGNRTQGI